MQNIEEIFPDGFKVLFPIEVEKFIRKGLDEFTDKLIEEQVETFRKSLLSKKIELTTEIITLLQNKFELDERNLTISFPVKKGFYR